MITLLDRTFFTLGMLAHSLHVIACRHRWQQRRRCYRVGGTVRAPVSGAIVGEATFPTSVQRHDRLMHCACCKRERPWTVDDGPFTLADPCFPEKRGELIPFRTKKA